MPQLITEPTEDVRITIAPQPQVQTTTPYSDTDVPSYTVTTSYPEMTEQSEMVDNTDYTTIGLTTNIVETMTDSTSTIGSIGDDSSSSLSSLTDDSDSSTGPSFSSVIVTTDDIFSYTNPMPITTAMPNSGQNSDEENVVVTEDEEVVIVIGNATSQTEQNDMATEEPITQSGVNGKVDMPAYE